jgi:hypothetical protein
VGAASDDVGSEVRSEVSSGGSELMIIVGILILVTSSEDSAGVVIVDNVVGGIVDACVLVSGTWVGLPGKDWELDCESENVVTNVDSGLCGALIVVETSLAVLGVQVSIVGTAVGGFGISKEL